ncbi:MAG: DUF4974 domain-containing protein [Planctomycetia bacterium]|nr:DUF4974 domain-containing protein [Planctomycetia bacterium]
MLRESFLGRCVVAIVSMAVAGLSVFVWAQGHGGVVPRQRHRPISIEPALAENAQVRAYRPAADDPAAAAIERALAEAADFDFVEQPLSRVLEHVRTAHKITVLPDRKALEDVAINLDTPTTCKLKGVSLRSALRHVLGQLELRAVSRDGVLLVTSATVADIQLETRVYDVSELYAALRQPADDLDDLIKLLASTVQPRAWEDAGGPGSMAGLRGRLIVSTTANVHDEIARTLQGLAAAVRQQVTAKGAERYVPIRCDLSAAETAIRKKLDGKHELVFNETPLADVAKTLREKLGVEVQFDLKALEDVGVSQDTPVTFKSEGLPVRTALDHVLGPLELAWAIENELLLITSKTVADTKLVARVYPVADLLGDVSEPDYDTLIGAHTTSVSPESWSDAGGPAHVRPFAASGCLVISQMPAVHQEMETLLAMLRKSLAEQPVAVYAPRRVLRIYLLATTTAPETQPPGRPPQRVGTTGGAGQVVVVPAAAPDPQRPTAAELASLIQERIAPDSWQAYGGRGYIRDLTGALVIEHTAEVHAEIQKLLAPFGVKMEEVRQ